MAELNYQFRENDEEYFIEDIGEIKKKPLYDFFKRFFDFFLSLIAIIILIVPMIIVGIIVKCTSKGPAIYKQKRLT